MPRESESLHGKKDVRHDKKGETVTDINGRIKKNTKRHVEEYKELTHPSHSAQRKAKKIFTDSDVQNNITPKGRVRENARANIGELNYERRALQHHGLNLITSEKMSEKYGKDLTRKLHSTTITHGENLLHDKSFGSKLKTKAWTVTKVSGNTVGKAGAKTGKMVLKISTTAVHGQLAYGSNLALDEVTSLGKTALRFGARSAVSASTTTVSSVVKGIKTYRSSVISRNFVNKTLKWMQRAEQHPDNSYFASKSKKYQQKMAKKQNAKNVIYTKGRPATVGTVGAISAKAVGTSAIAKAKGAVKKAPVRATSFGFRQFSKVVTDQLGATDPTLSRMGKSLKTAAKVPYKAYKTIKRTINFTKSAMKVLRAAGKAVVKVVQVVGQAIVHAVTAIISNPYVLAAIGGIALVVILVLMVGNSCSVIGSSLFATGESIYPTQKSVARWCETRYKLAEKMLLADLGIGETNPNYDTIVAMGVQNGDLKKGQFADGELTRSTVTLFDYEGQEVYHNPYFLCSYMTAKYGIFEPEDLNYELRYSNPDGIFFNQYTYEIEIEHDDSYNKCADDPTGNGEHEWQEVEGMNSETGAQELYWQCVNCGKTSDRLIDGSDDKAYHVSVTLYNHGFDATAQELLIELQRTRAMEDDEDIDEDAIVDGESGLLGYYNFLSFYYGNTDKFQGEHLSKEASDPDLVNEEDEGSEVSFWDWIGAFLTSHYGIETSDTLDAEVFDSLGNEASQYKQEFNETRVYYEITDPRTGEKERLYADDMWDKLTGLYEYWWGLGEYATHDEDDPTSDEAFSDEAWQRFLNRESDAQTTFTYVKSSGQGTGSFIIADEMIWPLSSDISGYRTLTSAFGPRNINIGSSNHKGLDIGVASGSQVCCIADGTVEKVAYDGSEGGRGWYVIVDHPSLGISSLYQHLGSNSGGRIQVSVNQELKQGDIVALSGNSGYGNGWAAYGSHLHFEISGTIPYNYNYTIDPMIYYGGSFVLSSGGVDINYVPYVYQGTINMLINMGIVDHAVDSSWVLATNGEYYRTGYNISWTNKHS